jgi:CHAD domain-containing protein
MAETIADYLARQLAAQIERVRAIAARLPDDASPEALHELRVQTRRLRAALRAARSVYSRFHVRIIERALGELIDLTNPARDAEVLVPLVHAAALPAPVMAELESPLARWQDQAVRSRARLLAALAEGALTRPLLWLTSLTTLPVKPSRNGPAAKLARRAVRYIADDFATGLARIESDLADPAALHTVRLVSKRLRYLIDFYGELLPHKLRRLEPLARSLQTELGNLHDLDILLERFKKTSRLKGDPRDLALAWAESARATQTQSLLAATTTAQTQLAKLLTKS